MTPDDVHRASALLEKWACAQADLVACATGGLAVRINGTCYAHDGHNEPVQGAVRRLLVDMAQLDLAKIAADLSALGVEPPAFAEEARAVLQPMGNDRVPGGQYVPNASMPVLSDEGRTTAEVVERPLQPGPTTVDDEIPF